ncbi:calcium-binding protein [Rhizobium sp. TH2]|uniref:calcium-binding protein n=1 Tax=Rhizobium sp. TH2 TaxID=2775403 RepID=UPI002157E0C5|nr:calcium-binding protein [Rhizobium sp. TH2]UVC10324.1 calcium-binding protein [Rhizobium sp. TH2]
MVMHIFNSDSIGAGIRAYLGQDDALFVKSGVLVASTDGSTTIRAGGFGTVLHIDGQVISENLCLDIGTTAPSLYMSIYLGESSVVRSYLGTAIALHFAEHTIEMHGKVFATLDGLQLSLGDGAESYIANAGTIDADLRGIFLETLDDVFLENTGMINGDTAGIWVQGTSGDVWITNSGTIKSSTSGITNIGDGALHIENSGLIRLGAFLGDQSDIYDGRLGRITGTLVAGAGDDTVKGGTSDESFQGGAGRDLLSGGGGADQFIYVNAGDSTLEVSGRDLISDFSHKGRDIIDFSTLIPGELDFVGKSHFSGADEIRYQISGKSTFVYLNLDADPEAEMAIQFAGKIKFVESDFSI